MSSASLAPTLPVPGSDNLRGGMWMLFSVVTASAMTLAARELTSGMGSRMVVFLRAAVVVVALAPLLAVPRFRRMMRFSRPWLHLARGGLIGVSTQLGFYSIAHMPLAAATVLFFTAPIFATLLAGPVNGEKVGPRRWAAVGAGFLGALIVLRPGAGDFEPAAVAALVSSLMFAAALSMSRGLAEADGAPPAYVSSVVLTALVGLPLALPVWSLPGDAAGRAVLAVLMLTSTARGIGDRQAYRLGEASVTGVISHLRLVLIGAAAWWLFGEVPGAATWIGGAVIVASTLYIARRAALRRRAPPPPPETPA